jgi:hypothetical protein
MLLPSVDMGHTAVEPPKRRGVDLEQRTTTRWLGAHHRRAVQILDGGIGGMAMFPTARGPAHSHPHILSSQYDIPIGTVAVFVQIEIA